MNRDANVVTQERFGASINSGDLGIIDEVVAADAVDHAPGQRPGPQGCRPRSRTGPTSGPARVPKTCSPRCAARSLTCTSRSST